MHRRRITIQEFQELEVYCHQLTIYCTTDEYNYLSKENRAGIDDEIIYMSIALDVMANLFKIISKTTIKPVVAWKKTKEREIYHVFRFSCIKVASIALDIPNSNIYPVCAGKRQSAGGYYFQYEDDYNQEQNLKTEEHE